MAGEADGDAPEAFGSPVRVAVLGPLQLVVDGRAVDVRGTKRRAVLALLVIAQGRVVTVDALVDALWSADAPESGRQALQSHVSRLRAHLGSASTRLHTSPAGYRLDLPRGGLDLAEARELLASGRGRLTSDPRAAYGTLRRALALWRGEPLAELAEFEPISMAATEWARLRRDLDDAVVSAGIAAGRADEVLALAAESCGADPLREPAVLLLMRALAATGSPAEALRIAREFRRLLAEETGLDPSPALGLLERDVAGGAAGPLPPRAGAPARALTPLLGREAELATLGRLLQRERLVTLVGPGGVGKTRVALEVAQQHATTTVLLAPITDPASIPHALASALNLNVVQGDVLAACLAVLGDEPGLLLVDNCEHLLDAARDAVDAILSSCPALVVLTTSREPLGLAAERVVRLAPLPVPGLGGDATGVPSVQLFLDRAARVLTRPPAWPAELRPIVDIVRRLDGIPLAIELAAGRLSTFSIVDLQRRLDRSLDLIGGARPSGDARHRTLRATIEWSYQLLLEDERRLFRHLAIFADGVDLDTAERIAADVAPDREPGSLIARLVDASMVEARFDGGTRFRMLETLRAFGLDRLAASGEDGVAAALYIRWAVEFARWVGTTLESEQEPDADAALRRERPNLRAAWRLARDRAALDESVAIVTALFYAIAYRDLVEIRDWAEELADDPALHGHPQRPAVLATAAEAAYQRGDLDRAERLATTSLAEATDDAARWLGLSAMSVVDLARGRLGNAIERSLAAADLAVGPRESLGVAALVVAFAGDLGRARSLNELCLAEAESPTIRAWGEYVAAEIDALDGRPGIALDRYGTAIALSRRSGATFLVGVATVGQLSVLVAAGRIGEALAGYREVIDAFARTGNWTHLWATLRNLADLLRRLGDPEAADAIDAAADCAPDAPAVATRPAPAACDDPFPAPAAGGYPRPAIAGRAAVLEVARAAIDRARGRA